ncbi:hypothetical protein TWF192_010674 [Orbilia oligospora]|uniref:Uncharacterized protein n=1 Tax=Orbilia oligospora TaxID=2813651 RepID=A0A6G1LXL8_ORBOL|nr:hypothetical protein TWF191_001498 [Orbilia oligospora]KAF3206241.1 hypothetical protein TWF191_001498 [Orbilia oligospora]KAF3206242.1 hypothetical protein TWF191_001498 [Orbilia oligospora]KAF3238091.1 hypothetical protein TWF192_010674 [Orbilia oligospora]KAF3238092.1 hypothetical protein TWF192_010674 [Orbilia oligospora]
MLDINQTQIVSREDLIPPKSPERPVQTVDWSSILGYSLGDSSAAQENEDEDDDISIASNPHPAEVSFRLFAPTNDDTAATNVQSYILPASPPPEQQALLAASLTADIPQVPHFSEQDVQNAHATHRPTTYYLTPPLEDDELRATRFRDVAVSGEQVLEESQKSWPGCELSWRVMKLSLLNGKDGVSELKSGMTSASTATATTTIVLQATSSIKEGRKRHRPNKKRRIIMRKRRVAKEETEAKQSKNAIKKKNKKKRAETTAAVQAIVHKRTEDEDREKKARMNRLKKERRKNKGKEAKSDSQS